MAGIVLLIFLTITAVLAKDPSLESYNVDKSQLSVSGISSGACMATQLHVIFSKHFMGAGLIAGVPYGCSGGNLGSALSCMNMSSMKPVSQFESLTSSKAQSGSIDPTSNMANDKIYIFAGTLDSVVRPENSHNMEKYYSHYIHNKDDIMTVYNIPAQHSMPTESYGGACGQLNQKNYINNCGYSAAYDLLNHIYGGQLRKPSSYSVSSQPGRLLKFDQTEFTSSTKNKRLLLSSLLGSLPGTSGSSSGGFDPTSYTNQILGMYGLGGSGSGSGKGSGSGTGSATGSTSGSTNTGGSGGSSGFMNPLLSAFNGLLGSSSKNTTNPLLSAFSGSNLLGSLTSGNNLMGSLNMNGLLGAGGSNGMDSTGYIYIPSRCTSESTEKCKLHVALHGCKMGRAVIGEDYVRNSGYNEVAEENNIIIMYPQAVSTTMSNPNGCWDWWGYTNSYFDTNKGVQIEAIRKMLERAMGSW